VRKADNLPPSCAVVTKSGNVNFLEPSGPVQAVNGTALLLPLLSLPYVWVLLYLELFIIHVFTPLWFCPATLYCWVANASVPKALPLLWLSDLPPYMIIIDLSLVLSDISHPPIKTKLMVCLHLPGYFHWHTSKSVGCYILHTSGYMTSAFINPDVQQQVYNFYLFICNASDIRALDSRNRVFQCEIKMEWAWHLIKMFYNCVLTSCWQTGVKLEASLGCVDWCPDVPTLMVGIRIAWKCVVELRVLGSSRRFGGGFRSSGTWCPVIERVVPDVSKHPLSKQHSVMSQIPSILIPQHSFESERQFVCGKTKPLTPNDP